VYIFGWAATCNGDYFSSTHAHTQPKRVAELCSAGTLISVPIFAVNSHFLVV
jgi:hypothetical protein